MLRTAEYFLEFENIRKIVLTWQQQQMPAKTCSVYVLDFLIRIISGDTVVNIYSLWQYVNLVILMFFFSL